MLGREFAQPDEALIEDLLRAYADEWFAHYNYAFVASVVQGPSSASISAVLRQKSAEALRRADRLAARLLELGSQPIEKLTDLVEHATDKPFRLPEDLRDVDGLLRSVLDAERTSLRTYRRLYEATRERDVLSSALALELLTECVGGEQQMERLLGDEAPELDGT